MRLSPSPWVGKTSTPNVLASAARRCWVGPIHWAPTSTTWPPPMSSLSTRPPTRKRASSTTTDAPAATTSRAAASPARPAPTTTTSASVVRRSAIGGTLSVPQSMAILLANAAATLFMTGVGWFVQ